MKKTVLITGAGGVIGKVLRPALAGTYTLRCLDRTPIVGVETIVADVRDMEAMRAACEGVDSVIHLAVSGFPEASEAQVLSNNGQGAYAVFEAAAQAHVPQVIFASSGHVVSGHELEHAPGIYRTGIPLMTDLTSMRPADMYGASKCCGEVIGRLYADHRGLRVIILRIGAINPADDPYYYCEKEDQERLGALWLSHSDCVQLFTKSLEADKVAFGIFYGVSNNANRFYNIQHAREVLGYEPQDNSGAYRRPPRQE